MVDSGQFWNLNENNSLNMSGRNLQSVNSMKPSVASALSTVTQTASCIKSDDFVSNSDNLKDTAYKEKTNNLCDNEINLKERLKTVTSIWFLCEIKRAEAIDLLKNKEPCCFIVRHSSKPNAMALSVRLPFDKGPHIEHYLIEDAGQGRLHLEGSENYFSCVFDLVVHYCHSCDELPVQLLLPFILMKANLSELTCYSRLGKNFWHHLKQLQVYNCDLENIGVSSLVDFDKKLSEFILTSENCGMVSTLLPHTSFCESNSYLDLTKLKLNNLTNFDKNLVVNFKKSLIVPTNLFKIDKMNIPKPPPRTSLLNRKCCLSPPNSLKITKPDQEINENNLICNVSKSFSSMASTPSFFHSVDIDLQSPLSSIEKNQKPTVFEKNNQNNSNNQKSFINVEAQEKASYKNFCQISLPDTIQSSKKGELNNCYYYSNFKDKFSDYEDIFSGTFNFVSSPNFKNSIKDHTILEATPKSILSFQNTQANEKLIKSSKHEFSFLSEPIDSVRFQNRRNLHFNSETDLTQPFFTSTFNKTKSHSFENLLHCFKKNFSAARLSPKNEFYHNFLIQNRNFNHDQNQKNRYHNQNYEHFYIYNVNDHATENQTLLEVLEKTNHKSFKSELSTDNDDTHLTNKNEKNSFVIDFSWKWHCSKESLCKANVATSNTSTNKYFSKTSCSAIKKSKLKKPNKFFLLDQEKKDFHRYRKFSTQYAQEISEDFSPNQSSDSESEYHFLENNLASVEDLIALKAPELKVPKIETTIDQEKKENYDCVTLRSIETSSIKFNRNNLSKTSGGAITDTETIFSEPWDSEYWENLMNNSLNRNGFPTFVNFEQDDSTFSENEFLNKFLKNNLVKKKRIRQAISPATSILTEKDLSKLEEEDDCSNSEKCSTLNLSEVLSFTSDTNSDVLSSSVCFKKQNQVTMLFEMPNDVDFKTAYSKSKNLSSAAKNLCNYIYKLAEENDNTFAKLVTHFVDCTKVCQESSPKTVMGNIRQFMNGMKNYLVKHGEKNFLKMVKKERNKLNENEFLNIDAIIESTLHKLVIKPLYNHLNQLFVEEYKKNGNLKTVSDNMKTFQTMQLPQLGIRPELNLPNHSSMVIIQNHFDKLQRAYSPLKKLEHLLAVISTIYDNVECKSHFIENMSDNFPLEADDFLSLFIYVIVKCRFISAEIEVDYMRGLLHSSMLSGKGGYYLTTLSSCIQVLKNVSQIVKNNQPESYIVGSLSSLNSFHSFNSSPFTQTTNTTLGSSSIINSHINSLTDSKGFIKILIPNELSCSIVTKILPIHPDMTVKEVCKMIAHKFNLPNSEEYGLFQLIDDNNEIQLDSADFPHFIKSEKLAVGKKVNFAYKRVGAKFIWPKISDN